MKQELIGNYAAATDREQMGRFLRGAYSLSLSSFAGLARVDEEESGEMQDTRPNPTKRLRD